MPTSRTLTHTSPEGVLDLSEAPAADLAVVPAPAASPTRRRRLGQALRQDSGQGTVEYVGLLLLMATVLAGVVAAAGGLKGEEKIGQKVVDQVSESIEKTAAPAPKKP